MENVATFSRFFAREYARYTTQVNLAISAGWMLKAGRRSQRRAPPTTVPTPGTRTSTRSTMLTSSMGYASRASRRYPSRTAVAMTIRPTPAATSCRSRK